MRNAEKRVVLQNLPTSMILNEIHRRENVVTGIHKELCELISSITETTELEEMQQVFAECIKVLKKD